MSDAPKANKLMKAVASRRWDVCTLEASWWKDRRMQIARPTYRNYGKNAQKKLVGEREPLRTAASAFIECGWRRAALHIGAAGACATRHCNTAHRASGRGTR